MLSRLPRPIITVTAAVGLIWGVSGTAGAVVPSAATGGSPPPIAAAAWGGRPVVLITGDRQRLTLIATHLPLAQAGPITGAGLAVSFDGGKTWRRATVAGAGPGRFVATFTAPAGALVTLRASARDAAGNSVTETITRGYAIANP